jgi:hypothetical protein
VFVVSACAVVQNSPNILWCLSERKVNGNATGTVNPSRAPSLIANLDLVISSDTAVAHLAGAMGKPVWLMLSQHADWRWLLGRDDSPWYGTMRLFRQKRVNDWPDVVRRIYEALSHPGGILLLPHTEPA